MTATTKEQREDLHSLTAIDWLLDCPGGPIPNTVASDALRHLPALLSDSERLAAIEAMTGEEVKWVVTSLQIRGNGEMNGATGINMRGAETILYLSAKVAEQAEEIERTRQANIWVCDISQQLKERAESAEAERDTLRRLLTETAVPALDNARLCIDGPAAECARKALSTIRAQIGDSPTAPQPARCSTCDDTRVIYGHGSFETSCPACHDADAEVGLAMLGGDGRG